MIPGPGAGGIPTPAGNAPSIDDMPEANCPKLRRLEPSVLEYVLKLTPEHAGLIEGTAGEPGALLMALDGQRLRAEALRLLAYGLPEREAVWWSCMCVRHTATPLADGEAAALEAAEDWVRRPEPRTRREAAMAASAVGYVAAGAWSALGASWSHRDEFLVDLCGGRGAAMATERAWNRRSEEPARLERRYRAFLASGLEIGSGGAGRLPLEHAEAG